jgi:translation initiation factor IF-1
MPGKSNTNQTISKKNIHRMESNNKAVYESFTDYSAVFGRVIKLLGGNRVSLVLANTHIIQAQIRGLLRKRSTPINPRDIVILEKSDSDEYYIIGIVFDRKDVSKLSKDSRIPKWFTSSDIDINEVSKCVVLSTNTLIDTDYVGYEITNDSGTEDDDEDDETKKFDKANKKDHRAKLGGGVGGPGEESNEIDIDNI